MKKLLIAAAATLAFAGILPQNIGGMCTQTGYFTSSNPPIPLNDFMKVVKKYDCNGRVIYIGIEDRIPGILKLNVNNNTPNFLLEHFTFKGYKAAVYIDKNIDTGAIAIKLNNKYALKVIFYGSDYKSVLKYLQPLNLEKIKEQLS